MVRTTQLQVTHEIKKEDEACTVTAQSEDRLFTCDSSYHQLLWLFGVENDTDGFDLTF